MFEPTPFYRSTSDRIERPSLREVLSEGSAFFTQPYQTEEAIAELPQEEATYAELPQEEPPIEPEQVALLDEQVAPAPEPSPKKKGGRPKGSKNKPKGE
jgi:hypothetical protein